MSTFKIDGRQGREKEIEIENEKACLKGLRAIRVRGYLRKRCLSWKLSLLKLLESMDARLTNGQRKWLFYIGITGWSCFLLSLLVATVRRPPEFFVLPPAVDSSHIRLKVPGAGGITETAGRLQETANAKEGKNVEEKANYLSTLKIEQNEAKQTD